MDILTILGATTGAVLGGLVTISVFAMKVLPQKVTRREVAEMISTDPLHTKIAHLEGQSQWSREELTAIRREIMGLRTDLARFTGVLETLIRDRE